MYFNDFILESSCWLILCHGRVLLTRKMQCAKYIAKQQTLSLQLLEFSFYDRKSVTIIFK